MSSSGAESPARNARNAPHENTNGDNAGCGDEQTVTPRRTPLPVRQLFILALMRFSEPISFCVIFPFVNQMIEEIGVTDDPKAVGYYSGLVEGIFAVAQFCTAWYLGSLSDRVGRRPVLIIGLCGVIISTILFGFSKSFSMMLISRMIGGGLSGNSGVIKSAVGEITDETNQGAAFAYLPLAWLIGSLVAPALGGLLSHPVERYPSIFHSFTLLERYPYLLPCLAGAILSSAGVIAGIFFLEETLASKRPGQDVHPEQRPLLSKPVGVQQTSYQTTPSCSSPASTNSDARPYSNREILTIPAVQGVLLSYAFMALVTVAVEAVFILWLYTPVSLGGLGFSSAEIGGALSLSGILGTMVAVIVFPPLERRVGATILFQIGMILQVVAIVAFPFGNALATSWGKRGAYISVGAILIVRCLAGIVFVCNMILINRSSPSPSALGAVNGLAQMVASASRAVGPGMAKKSCVGRELRVVGPWAHCLVGGCSSAQAPIRSPKVHVTDGFSRIGDSNPSLN
ncbi:major facilitator superfamily transporter [Ceratobasidium sp. AG-Ba]|nr:major facilitator superfamily transporter [Ceratobasidium sp. AG-Ba]QRW06438.1 major facilitator superfamily transporter [Ceratobasidium sp. AG-Ba]